MSKLTGRCPSCGSDQLEVQLIGTCTQRILHWENDNPAWATNPVHGELVSWDMEWDCFICSDCDETFGYDDIAFEEES